MEIPRVTAVTAVDEVAAVARLAALKCPELLRVEQEGLCPECHQIELCSVCSGTRRRFPGLVEKCLGNSNVPGEHCQYPDGSWRPCVICNLTGYYPVSPADALYWLMGQDEAWIGGPTLSGKWRAKWDTGPTIPGPTPLLALARAIDAMEMMQP